MAKVSHLVSLGCILLFTACGRQTSERADGQPVDDTTRLIAYFESFDRDADATPIDSSWEHILEWNRETLAEAYKRIGKRDPAWDKDAIAALDAFALVLTSQSPDSAAAWEPYRTHLEKAIDAGCDDPLVRYCYARDLASEHMSTAEAAEHWGDVADVMIRSSYHDFRKLYANFRAYLAMRSAEVGLKDYRTALYNRSCQLFSSCANQPEIPVGLITTIGTWWLDSFASSIADEHFRINYLHPINRHWGGALEVDLLNANFVIKHAWAARGNGFANTVSDEGWRLYRERLRAAESMLFTAWFDHKGEPAIAYEMLSVGLGLSFDRADYDLWFERIMTAAPDHYQACSRKLHYLKPRWHGSFNEMIEFGRRCVTNTNWTGRVPLILVDAHDHIANQRPGAAGKANYWKNPEVWRDVDMAFARFFELNPDATGWHHNYALYAYRCEAWETLRREIGLLGKVNHDYFGGVEAFEEMQRLAFEHTDGETP